MQRIALALTTLAFLAACGASGAPVTPGVTVTGTVGAGIAKNG